MVVVRITGGLGNQMFQYAAGRAASLRIGETLFLDTRFFYNSLEKQAHEESVLLNLFPNLQSLNIEAIDRDYFSAKEINSHRFIQRHYNSLRTRLGLEPTFKTVTENQFLTYQNNFHDQKANILYLAGDWQNEEYFIKYASAIRNDFVFPAIESGSLNDTFLKKIKQTNSISLHVRRGDYLASAIHKPASMKYYTEACNILASRVNNPTFFIFSDDIEWCRDNFNLSNTYYISHNTGSNSYIDMQLMSQCKHNVIANSSFSWWGAWLNNNSNKIVVSPKVWLEKHQIMADNIVPLSWIII